MNKEFRKIRSDLIERAEKEANKLFRLAWRAQKHGCSADVVEEIRNEARKLHVEITAYPERLLDPFRKWNYAFR